MILKIMHVKKDFHYDPMIQNMHVIKDFHYDPLIQKMPVIKDLYTTNTLDVRVKGLS